MWKLFERIFAKGTDQKNSAPDDKDVGHNHDSQIAEIHTKSWSQEAYEAAVTQRNLFVFLTLVSIVSTVLAVLSIRYIKERDSVEPFVIEIDKRTGVPTLVDQISVKDYSANEAIKRYFVMLYIKAREEYLYPTFQYNYNKVVRIFSTPSVYLDYRNTYIPTNVQGPFANFDQNATRTVEWKSIIFPATNVAQVRLRVSTQSNNVSTESDKVVLLSFSFKNLQMSDEMRLINPLGFTVDMYRITDENPNNPQS